MHNRNEFCLEPGLHITGNVFNGGGNGVASGKWQVHDYTKAFNLEIGLVQVGRGEAVATGEEIDRGDRVGKVELLGGGVCSGSQISAYSVGKKMWEVHLGVAMLDGRVSGDEE